MGSTVYVVQEVKHEKQHLTFASHARRATQQAARHGAPDPLRHRHRRRPGKRQRKLHVRVVPDGNSSHTDLLNEYNLQPRNIPDMTVAQVIERMGHMHDPVVPPPWEPCGYRWYLHPKYWASCEGWLKDKLAEEGGLCIDCVRSCDKGVKAKCRKKHEV